MSVLVLLSIIRPCLSSKMQLSQVTRIIWLDSVKVWEPRFIVGKKIKTVFLEFFKIIINIIIIIVHNCPLKWSYSWYVNITEIRTNWNEEQPNKGSSLFMFGIKLWNLFATEYTIYLRKMMLIMNDWIFLWIIGWTKSWSTSDTSHFIYTWHFISVF